MASASAILISGKGKLFLTKTSERSFQAYYVI